MRPEAWAACLDQGLAQWSAAQQRGDRFGDHIESIDTDSACHDRPDILAVERK
jgi:hypothetical protein